MSTKPATITDVVSAFDAVVPGYAWAWHDANAPKFQRGSGPSQTGGWRDRRRTRLKFGRDRCLLIYGLAPNGWLSSLDPDAAETDIALFNRGYLPLARLRLTDPSKGLERLMALGPDTSWQDWEKRRMTWFYTDSCDFAKRTAITLSVLAHIHEHTFAVHPLWQDGDLTQSS